MKMFNKTMLSICLIAATTGSAFAEENSKIKEVKDYIYKEVDRTLTVGNALDTRDMCKETTWDFKVDSRKREVIEYTCLLTGFHEYLNQFSEDAVKLEKLKEEYAVKLEAKEKAETFIAFMQDMHKQKVIEVFSEVKKKTPSINKMSLFARGQTYDGVLEAGMAEKYVHKFMKASKIYNDALKDEKLAALADDPINASMFDEMTSKGYYNGKLFDSYMEGITKIRSKQYAGIEVLKEKIDYLERQKAHTKESKEAPPVKLTQTVGFTMIKDKPMVVYCDFNLYENATKTKPKAVEKINSYSVCLKESYQSEYDEFYSGVFNKLHVK